MNQSKSMTMKKLFTSIALLCAAFGFAQAQDQTGQTTRLAEKKAIALTPVMQRSSSEAVAKESVVSEPQTATVPQHSIVMTNEQVDAAIVKIERQMAQLEGTEGYRKEDHLKKIEILNNRRPANQ
jgi:hypothetical protein